jgi:hypothetical protein
MTTITFDQNQNIDQYFNGPAAGQNPPVVAGYTFAAVSGSFVEQSPTGSDAALALGIEIDRKSSAFDFNSMDIYAPEATTLDIYYSHTWSSVGMEHLTLQLDAGLNHVEVDALQDLHILEFLAPSLSIDPHSTSGTQVYFDNINLTLAHQHDFVV